MNNLNVRSLLRIETAVYAGTFGGGIFSIDNASSEWKEVNTGLTNKNVSVLYPLSELQELSAVEFTARMTSELIGRK